MRRRHVLKTGLLAGLGFTMEQFAPCEARPAPSVAATFYQGTLTGGPATNWSFMIGVAAKRVRGYANGGAPSSTITGFRMTGYVRGTGVVLTVYDRKDYGEKTPLGTLKGTLHGSALAGTFSLGHAGSGTFTTQVVRPDLQAMAQMAGTYQGQVNNAATLSGTGVLTANGTWRLSQVKEANNAPFPYPLSGYWVADADQPGVIYTIVTPTTAKGHAAAAVPLPHTNLTLCEYCHFLCTGDLPGENSEKELQEAALAKVDVNSIMLEIELMDSLSDSTAPNLSATKH